MSKNKEFFNRFYSGNAAFSVGQKIADKIRAPFYRVLGTSQERYVKKVLEVAAPAQCLEIGLGTGGLELQLSKNKQVKVYAIDISEEAINRAKNKVGSLGEGKNIEYICCSAEETHFPDNSFDLIYGKWILHHLNIEISMNEIVRILKPGGKAIFIEPLGTNPLINFFRRRTPHLRVEDEHPLTMTDIGFIAARFGECQFEYHHFLFFLAPFMSSETLHNVERSVLLKYPSLNRWCWQVLMTLKKPARTRLK